jgi:hypothetical protein
MVDIHALRRQSLIRDRGFILRGNRPENYHSWELPTTAAREPRINAAVQGAGVVSKTSGPNYDNRKETISDRKENVMAPTMRVGLAAGLVLACGNMPGRADVIVRVPFVAVEVGAGGVHVRAPFVYILLPSRRRVVISQPAPVEELLPPLSSRVVPRDWLSPRPEPSALAGKPLTLAEFAERFKPAPGSYEVVLIHPVSKAPVAVRFTLPNGAPKAVRALPRQLVFNYGRDAVRLRFKADGSVKVISR